MLWIKAFHIIFVISWFAGLLYLPRIFVNLAMLAPDAEAERTRLLLMARKLLRFTTWLSIPAVGLGLYLWLGFGFSGGWLHAKLLLVLLAIAYNHLCTPLLKSFAKQENKHSETWYRWFNEIPIVLLTLIVLLVVLKPF